MDAAEGSDSDWSDCTTPESSESPESEWTDDSSEGSDCDPDSCSSAADSDSDCSLSCAGSDGDSDEDDESSSGSESCRPYSGKKVQRLRDLIRSGKELAVSEDAPLDVPEDLRQDCPLLRLPGLVLRLVCRQLSGRDLVRLGLVSRGCRHVARHPAAWGHVRASCSPLLAVAPALRSLDVGYSWPPPFPLRLCTRRVREFTLDMEQEYTEDGEELDWAAVVRTLRHYKGHLQVVHLGCLKNVKFLHAIDRLHIKELYVGNCLVKVYPGSSKVVKTLSFWQETSSDVAIELLKACRSTLTTFKIDGFRQYKNEVACDGRVGRALRLCKKLMTASIPMWGKVSLLNDLPALRKLCIYDFGYNNHSDVKKVFASSPVAAQLDTLTLHMDYQDHRGLVKAVAAGCTALRTLRLMYKSTDSMGLSTQVNVARDLPAVLSPLKNLRHLTLSVARVPSPVFKALQCGILPDLEQLELKFCGVTAKGRGALRSLVAARPGLVSEYKVSRASLDEDGGWFSLGGRCKKAICAEGSDCDEDDPVDSDEEAEVEADDEEPIDFDGPIMKLAPDPFDAFMAMGDGEDTDDFEGTDDGDC